MDQFKPFENGMLIGPQPTEGDVRQAKQKGIKTVIDLRMPRKTSTPKEELVARSGLDYVNIPVNQASSLSLSMGRNFSGVAALSTGLLPRTDAHKAAQARTVVQRLLAGQIEPLLDEVNAQHALQTKGAGSRCPRWNNNFVQGRSEHDGFYRRYEFKVSTGMPIAPERIW